MNARTALEQIVGANVHVTDRVRFVATASHRRAVCTSEQIASASDEMNTLYLEASQSMVEAANAVTALAALSQKLEK